MATIRAVAARAGVSTATVSRVFNQPETVTQDTRDLVWEAVNALGYSPGKKRETEVKAKPSRLFGVILPDLVNPYYAELLDSLEHEAFHLGRSLLVFNHRNNPVWEMQFLEECDRFDVDGVFTIPSIQTAEHVARISERRFPVFCLTQLVDGMSSIAIDHAQGGRLVADHLVSLGHEAIGYMGPVKESEDKFVGFRNRLLELGQALQPTRLTSLDVSDSTEIKGCVRDFLAAHARLPFTALFVFNDLSAQAAIEVFGEYDIRVPDDVALVGFDNTVLARVLNFTSVAQPMREIGRLACRGMLEAIENRSAKTILEPLILMPRLMVRTSSASVAIRRQQQ